MKKSTKIILPALALLVLGTTAAATGTVAWFAANGVVSATGMQVKCATSKNLIISNTKPASLNANDTDKYGSAVKTINTGVKTLSPASTTNAALASVEPALFNVVDDPKTIDAISGGIKEGATIVKSSPVAQSAGEGAGRYAVHNFWVANSATANMDFKVGSLTVTNTETKAASSAAITKALRIAVVYQDQATVSNTSTYQVQIYVVAPNNGLVEVQGLNAEEATGVKLIGGDICTNNSTSDSKTKITATQTANLYSASSSSLGKIIKTENAAATLTDYKWSTLDVYVWYEGQDPNCTSNNAMTVESLDIELTFEAYQTNTPSQGQ